MERTVPDRTTIARIATRTALQSRRSQSIPRVQPVNSFDLAESLGCEVRFMDAPSLEGMFSRAPHPVIILPSPRHRPRGRLAFTCAHELGHCRLGHGTRVDHLVAEPHPHYHPEEHAADVFAGMLLMPRSVIDSAFDRRSLDCKHASPKDLFAISCELGVGFMTLVHHLTMSLHIMDHSCAERLKRVSPQSIRDSLLATPTSHHAILMDAACAAPSIDLEVNELLVAEADSFDPFDSIDRGLISEEHDLGRNQYHIYRAVRPGMATVSISGRDIKCRVCRTHYVGTHRNRFLEDPEIL